jgi:CHAD domain-containing protein
MNTLCLQLTKPMSPAEIDKKLNKNFFLPQKVQLRQEKLKTQLTGEKVKIKRQYTSQVIKVKNCPDITMSLEVGLAVFPEKVLEQRDIYLYYEKAQIPQVEKITAELLKTLPLLLVEPQLNFRFGLENGSFSPLNMPCYKTGTMTGGIWAHMAWQVYFLNGIWLKYLANPKDKVLLRQLRIKLRRLRSCLSFFRPVFKLNACTKWQKKLRDQGLALGVLRELDVMLITIVRLDEATKNNEGGPKHLQEIFVKKRDNQLAKFIKNTNISQQTAVLTEFMLWLQSEQFQPEYVHKSFHKFIIHRFKIWSKKILNMMEGSPDFSDMKKAHKIRIEIKKFRYVLLSFSEVNKGALSLLRKLKRLQDVLGFLHDDYINGNMVKNMAVKNKGASEYEAALFAGWESAKVESSIDTLRDFWQEFCTDLLQWRESLTPDKKIKISKKVIEEQIFPL